MNDLSLFADFYQLTMMQGYFLNERHNEEVVFDMFFRKAPSGSGYCIVAGLDDLVEFLQNIHFDDEKIDFLRSLNIFKEEFLNHLKDFAFTGEIYAVQEGQIIFAHEPILRVRANILQATYIEAAILSIVNFQTLIATKASRVYESAKPDPVMEFGMRRAQGLEASLLGTKAAIIGGCQGTSHVQAAFSYDLELLGTHSHAWIQSFPTELDAFKAYAKIYPDTCVLLVDTYDTLLSGVPNAIKVFHQLQQNGHEPKAIRIDSGDLEYLSKKARKMLDCANLKNVKIIASDNLDEYSIARLKANNAKIDSWGVGTKLITSYDQPSLGGVYKLSAIVQDDKIIPKMKLSEDPRKMNNPCIKQIYRLYDKSNHKALADLITIDTEKIEDLLNENGEITLFHPLYTYKTKSFGNFYAKALLTPLIKKGKATREKTKIKEVREFVLKQKESFWHEYLRNIDPATYKVDLSKKLWLIREDFIKKARMKLI